MLRCEFVLLCCAQVVLAAVHTAELMCAVSYLPPPSLFPKKSPSAALAVRAAPSSRYPEASVVDRESFAAMLGRLCRALVSVSHAHVCAVLTT